MEYIPTDEELEALGILFLSNSEESMSAPYNESGQSETDELEWWLGDLPRTYSFIRPRFARLAA